jgi:hypothetical protein
MDVYRHISRLKMLRNMREEQVTALFKLFLDVIKTDDQITEVDGMSYFFFPARRFDDTDTILSFYPTCHKIKVVYFRLDLACSTRHHRCDSIP